MFDTKYIKNAFNSVPGNITDPPNYTFDISDRLWLTKELEEKINSRTEINCMSCKEMKDIKNTNSSERDLIITVMIKYSYNLETFVRTLRSTGCKATLVIFHDEASIKNMEEFYSDMFAKCGVIAINLGRVKESYLHNIFEIRHSFYFTYIKKFAHRYDRIIICDLIDSFFQYDPFTEDFTNATFRTTTELVTFDTCKINQDWVSKADPHYDSMFYHGKIPLNFGLIYGSTGGWLIFYDLIFRMHEWKTFELKTIDQGYLNYYFYRGFFEDIGLHITCTLPNDTIISARGGKANNKMDMNGMVKLENSSVAPALLHHYNRFCYFWKFIQEKCPSIKENNTYSYAYLKEEKC